MVAAAGMIKLLFSFLFVVVAGAVFAKSPPVPSLAPEVERAVNGLIDEGKLAGAVVLVAKAGVLLHLGAFGERKLGSGQKRGRLHSMSPMH